MTRLTYSNYLQLFQLSTVPFTIFHICFLVLCFINMSNISIPNYDFVSQPTKSSAGGVMANEISFNIRDNLSYSFEEAEYLWTIKTIVIFFVL